LLGKIKKPFWGRSCVGCGSDMSFIGLSPKKAKEEIGTDFPFLKTEFRDEENRFYMSSRSPNEHPGVILTYTEKGEFLGVDYKIRIYFSTKDIEKRDDDETLKYVEFGLNRTKAALHLTHDLKNTDPKKRIEQAKKWLLKNELYSKKRKHIEKKICIADKRKDI